MPQILNLYGFNFSTMVLFLCTRCIKIMYRLIKLLVSTCTMADTTTGAGFADSICLQGDLTGSPDLECSYFSALAAYLVSLRSA